MTNPKEYKEIKFMRNYNTLDNYPKIKGLNYEKEFNFDEFIKSMSTTGIQSTQVARGIQIINQMIDEKSKILAREIAQKIEKEVSFPGQIKVNVIREKRIIEYAK